MILSHFVFKDVSVLTQRHIWVSVTACYTAPTAIKVCSVNLSCFKQPISLSQHLAVVSIVVVVQKLSHVWLLAIPWTAAHQEASVLPMNIQDWFPLGWTGWISLQSRRLSRVFSSTTVRKHQFFGVQPSLWPSSHIRTWLLHLTTFYAFSFFTQVVNLEFSHQKKNVFILLLKS